MIQKLKFIKIGRKKLRNLINGPLTMAFPMEIIMRVLAIQRRFSSIAHVKKELPVP
jgi:hypothetical protein